jgi:hypothetical protein
MALAAGAAYGQCQGTKSDAAKTASCHEKKDVATCQKSDGSKSCATKTESCANRSGDACPTLAGMPTMKFKVGDTVTPCCEKASELAGKDESKIQFVVADKSYATKSEALKAFAEQLDAYYADVTTVKYAVGDKTVACPMSAQELARGEGAKVRYQLASYAFSEKTAAEKAAEQARESAGKVAMKMVVDGKEFCCEKMGREAAGRDTVKTVEYVVGETRTTDESAARVELIKARIFAAVQSVKAAQEQAEKLAKGPA